MAKVDEWTSIGPKYIKGLNWPRATGRLTAIAIHPANPDIIYVGARGSGVWRTKNGGTSWKPITDKLPTLAIGAIAIDPSDPLRVYVATRSVIPGINGQIWRSDNEGDNWLLIHDKHLGVGSTARFIVKPDDPDILYLTTKTGVQMSYNGGKDWHLSLDAPATKHGEATDLVFDPSNPLIMYAGICERGIYKTTIGGLGTAGTGWQRLANQQLPSAPNDYKGAVRLAICRDQPNILYGAILVPGFFQIYRTRDGGASWVRKHEVDTSSTTWRSIAFIDYIAVDQQNPAFVYAPGIHFYRSEHNGADPDFVYGLHVDHHAYAHDPVNTGVFFACCDGGIYRSGDRAKTWKFIGEGIENVEFYDLALRTKEQDKVWGGTQDNCALLRINKNSKVWNYIAHSPGDTTILAVDPGNSNRIYTVSQAGFKSVQEIENSWRNIAANIPDASSASNYPVVQSSDLHVVDRKPGKLWAACNSLWSGPPSASGSPPTWTEEFTPPAGGRVSRWARGPDGYEYVGLEDGSIYVRRPGGGWHQQPPAASLPNAQVCDIKVDPFTPTTIYVAYRTASQPRVLRLTRNTPTGTAQTVLELSNDPLVNPAFPAGRTPKRLAIDPFVPFCIHAATDHGIYRCSSSDFGASWRWESYNKGFPPADTTALEVHPATGVMVAGTFGRGAYEVLTDNGMGTRLSASGRVSLLRVQDPGERYGAQPHMIDVDVVVQLDSFPGRAFGFQLRTDGNERACRSMLDTLRVAMETDRLVRLEYIRRDLYNNVIDRVIII